VKGSWFLSTDIDQLSEIRGSVFAVFKINIRDHVEIYGVYGNA
jgi:hypothetical protein